MLFFKTNIVLIKKKQKKLHNKLEYLIICVHSYYFFEHLILYKEINLFI